MPEIPGGPSEVTRAAVSLACEIELPEGWEYQSRLHQQPADDGVDCRRYPRMICRTNAALRCRQTIPAIPRREVWFRILLRNISRCGAGFIHSEQLFPGEEALLVLPNGSRRGFRVMRCQRIGPKCFEVGGEFQDNFGDLDSEQPK